MVVVMEKVAMGVVTLFCQAQALERVTHKRHLKANLIMWSNFYYLRCGL